MSKTKKRRPPHYLQPAENSVVQPIVVSTTEAGRMGCWGMTRLRELIAAGELESYLDGRHRRITVKSIYAYIARKQAAEQAKEQTA
jgi:hypothetical protein